MPLPTGYSGVFLVSTTGHLLLQHRDDNPAINHPGMICPFGGGIEPGETPLEAALREIEEETELRLTPANLTALGQLIHKRREGEVPHIGHFYCAMDIDETGLTIHEGRLIRLSFSEARRHPKLTPWTAEALTWLKLD